MKNLKHPRRGMWISGAQRQLIYQLIQNHDDLIRWVKLHAIAVNVEVGNRPPATVVEIIEILGIDMSEIEDVTLAELPEVMEVRLVDFLKRIGAVEGVS